MRDAGIDAMAALHSVFPDLLNGLSEHDSRELKYTFGAVMGEVVDRLINPAVRVFPELETDAAAWSVVVKSAHWHDWRRSKTAESIRPRISKP